MYGEGSGERYVGECVSVLQEVQVGGIGRGPEGVLFSHCHPQIIL